MPYSERGRNRGVAETIAHMAANNDHRPRLATAVRAATAGAAVTAVDIPGPGWDTGTNGLGLDPDYSRAR
jgi:hypothetical protein